MSIRKPKRERIRALRDEALELLRKGSNAAALVRFAELERLAPEVAEFPQRAADCHRNLGNGAEQIDALGRAAELYANQGAFAKAIALCKVILGVDPGHTRTQARLAELNGARQPAVAVPAPAPRLQPPPRLPVITMPAGSEVLSSLTAGTKSPSGAGSSTSGGNAGWSRPKRSLEQMLRLRRAELARAKLPTGGVSPVENAEADDGVEHAVSDSMLAPEGPTFDSMLAPDPVPVFDSVVAPEPSPSVVVAPEPSPNVVVAPKPSPSVVVEPEPSPSVLAPELHTEESVAPPSEPAPVVESLWVDAPESLLPAPDSIPRVPGSVCVEPSRTIPAPGPYLSELPPDSGDDAPTTNRLPPPSHEDARALPFLPEGSLNQMVPGSRPIPDGHGMPSGAFRIDLGALPAAAPPDPKRLAQRALPVTPLFSELGPESLAVLIANATLLHFEPGAVVYRQNDPSDRLFVVASGLVSIATEGEHGVEIARLGDNEFFGETALISNELRLSTARALEPTDVLAIERRTVTELVQKEPGLLKTVLRFLRERLVESLLLTNPLFTLLTGGERRRLAERFEFIEFDRGTQLIRQRSRSPGVFVLLCGTVEVTRREGANVRLLSLLHAGGVFGEMSLIGRDPACADVRSMSRGFALMLPEHDFRRVSEDHPQVLEFVQLLAEARKRQNTQPVQQDSIPATT